MRANPRRAAGGFAFKRLMLPALACMAVLVFVSGALAATDILVQPRLASKAPRIDGVVSKGEWEGARVTPLPLRPTKKFAVLRTMNDSNFLYILLDALGDTGNSRGVAADYYVLAFDRDLNHKVTPNEDVFYSSCQDGRQFIKSYYLSAASFTPCITPEKGSLGRYGFGPTPDSATPHRFYEFRILLSELGADHARWTRFFGGLPGVRLNVTLRSSSPKIDYSYPTNYPWPDMADRMFLIQLAPSSGLPTTGDIFAGVGLIPATPYIDNLGFANINTAYFTAVDAPFGGNLSIFGNWGNLRSYGAARYKIRYQRREGGSPGYLIQTWTNFRYNPVTLKWDPVAIGPVDAEGRYAIPPVGETWYYPNLLVNWQTANPLFTEGTYDLNLELFDAAGNPKAIPASVLNNLSLFIVNTPPQVKINRVLYNDAEVGACQIVNQGAAPSGFQFDISATDSKGALGGFNLVGIYGNNMSSPVYSDAYNPGHRNEDGANRWNGESNLVVPVGPRWRAPTTCGYSFILSAWSRVLNGYGLVFPYVDYHVSLTIQTGAVTMEPVEAESCAGCEGAPTGSGAPCKPAGL